MIQSCPKCGGLRVTEQFEVYAGTPCSCVGAVDNQRQQLEHSLATTFVELQRERNPERRQGKWMECLRLVKELEKLDD